MPRRAAGPTDADHIGARIRYWRRRRGGMTQTALAGLADLSQGYISDVESGHKSIERRSTLVAIARALQVSVADLLGQPGDSADPLKASAATVVPAIRNVLIEIEEGERRTPTRGHEEMSAAVDRIDGMRMKAEYAPMAGLLPDLLTDAAAYGGVTLARIAYATTSCLRNLGHRDLALSAARAALDGAMESEDLAWIGAARFLRTVTMPIEIPGVASRAAERALSELQADAADPRVRQVLGLLHLSASMVCAVDERPADAAAHLQAAEQEARTLGDPVDGVGFNCGAFGPTNIGLWRMAVAAELGEHGRVVELAGKVNPAPLRVAIRHQSYWLDYGRALAYSRKADAEARAALLRAERAAPVPFSVNPMAHDTVLMMVNRARRGAVPNDLRVLALRLGIDVATGR